MEKNCKMWRSGLAMLLALCLLISACPITTFAASTGSDPVKYVSVGDSMTNGNGFVGYNQDQHANGYDFFGNKGVYGDAAYPNQFEKYLAELNQDRGVEHTKLALSGLRAENLLYLLGITDSKPADGYNVYHAYAGNPSEAKIREHYQTAMAEADIISLALGSASFNAYFVDRALKLLGIGGSFTEEAPQMTLDDALAMMDDGAEKQLVITAYNTMMSEISNAVPAEMVAKYKLEELCNLATYTTASFVQSYKEILNWIGVNNDDAEVVLVGVANPIAGMNISGEGFSFDLGSAMEKVCTAISAYIGTLPAALQADGKYQNMKFYYAAQPSNAETIAAMVDDLAATGWGVVDRVDGSVVRAKIRDAYDKYVASMVAPVLANVPAEHHNAVHEIIYAGMEAAMVESLKSPEIKLEAIEKFDVDNGMAGMFEKAPVDAIQAVLGAASPEVAAAAYESAVEAFAKYFCSEDVRPVIYLFAMNLVGNGLCTHPAPATHDKIAASVIAAYGKHTVQDEIKENVEYTLSELKGFLDNMDPETTAVIKDKIANSEVMLKATTANLELSEKSVYVALGDGSAKPKGYVELVGDYLKSEFGIKSVRNYAVTGNTVGAELEKVTSRAEIAEASLITIGFGNVTMLHNAIRYAGTIDYDWEKLVGEELLPYVEEALASVYGKIAEMGLDEKWTDRLGSIVEGFAYSAVEYAIGLPKLVEEIRTVNADALIVVVGQYNPMSGVVLDLGGTTVEMSEYIDGLVEGVVLHGIGYAMLSGEVIFVEASEVDISSTDKIWTEDDLIFTLLLNGFSELYPSEAGDRYIADQILTAVNTTEYKPGSPFRDVAEGVYYYDAVLWAVENDITKGTGDGTTFEPNAGCTRAQIATFLWRAAGCPAPKSTVMPFKDVPANAYYATAVLWAAEKGITKGTGDGTTFEPETTCTRAQIVTMLCRYRKGIAIPSANLFKDVPVTAYYASAVAWAVKNGITTGTGDGTTFEPDATCTRGQIVTFLYRCLKK